MNNIFLLVSDEPSNYSVMNKYLYIWAREKHIELVYVKNNDDAIACINEKNGNVIIVACDYLKYDIDYLELAGYINKKELPIVIIPIIENTDKEYKQIISNIFKSGAPGIIYRPVNHYELLITVNSVYELSVLKRQKINIQLDIKNELEQVLEFQHRFFEQNLPRNRHFNMEILHENAYRMAFGGDYYEIYQISENELIVILTDVSGHGLKAAVITIILKALLLCEFEQVISTMDPARILKVINEKFFKILSSVKDIYIACAVCYFNGKKREMIFENAGQPPVIMVRDDRVVELTKISNLAVGIRPETNYINNVCRLEHNDRIIMVTDGLFPVGKTYTNMDVRQFYEILLRNNNAEKYSDQVFKEIMEKDKYAALMDDMTLISIKYTG